jgi:hypothetical protein
MVSAIGSRNADFAPQTAFYPSFGRISRAFSPVARVIARAPSIRARKWQSGARLTSVTDILARKLQFGAFMVISVRGRAPGLERYAPAGLSFPACGRAPSAHVAADGHAVQPDSPPSDKSNPIIPNCCRWSAIPGQGSSGKKTPCQPDENSRPGEGRLK